MTPHEEAILVALLAALREAKCGSDAVPNGYWSKLLGLMAKLPAAIEPPGPDPEPFV